MRHTLDYLWPIMEAQRPIVGAWMVADWPLGVHQQLIDRGLLVRIEDAQHVLCPQCGEHIEEVVAVDGPNGSIRLFVPCPEVLRAQVPPEARWQWQVNLDGVARGLASVLGLRGRSKQLVPQRVWRLGRTDWQATRRDVLLARGLGWEDRAAVWGTIRRQHRPILFVPQQRPCWRLAIATPCGALSRRTDATEMGKTVRQAKLVARQ